MVTATTSSSSSQVLSISLVSKESAIEDFMTFFQTSDFVELCGNIHDFKTALNKIYSDHGNDPRKAFQITDILFSELIRQAQEQGHLSKVADFFFADSTDRVDFCHTLSERIIEHVNQVEIDDGELVTPSEEAGIKAKEEFLTFVNSDNFSKISGKSLTEFKQTLNAIARRSHGDRMTSLVVDMPGSPSYCRLFRELIAEATQKEALGNIVRDTIFAPGFDEIKWLESVIAALRTEKVEEKEQR